MFYLRKQRDTLSLVKWNLNLNSAERQELEDLIAATVDKTGLLIPVAFEKDYYVTKIIHALSELHNDYHTIVFAGGTSLAKAHKIVFRMSEDCDFRLVRTEAGKELNHNQQRIKLRAFRTEILNTIKELGFPVTTDEVEVHSRGTHTRLFVPYDSVHPGNDELRPDVKIELIAIDTKVSPAPKQVTTLIRDILGEKVPHAQKAIETISVKETAADKWVALTRRVASTLHRDHMPADNDLVRHLYDLYYISQNGYLDKDLYQMIAQVIGEDSERYKNQNGAYYDDPIKEIKKAIENLEKNETWRHRWDIFNDNMVLSTKLSYQDALQSFVTHSTHILGYIESAHLKAPERALSEALQDHSDKAFWQQPAIAKELSTLEQHENPHIKRLIKLHHHGAEQGFTPDVIKGMGNALTQLTSNKVVLRILATNAPKLYEKTKTLQQTLDNDHGLSQ